MRSLASSRSPLLAALVGSLLGACGACDTCDGPPAALRVSGPHPYVRCMGLQPPAPGERAVGGLRLEVEGRTLRVHGAPSPARLAVFGGPAPAARLAPAALAPASDADLVVVLGGLGDAQAEASATAALLAALGPPVLFVAGGRDEPSVVEAAARSLAGEHRTRFVDATALERVVVGGHELVVVPGAPDGRYARVDLACGFSAADLQARAAALGEAGPQVRRSLLAWAAPAGLGAGIEGADPGSPELAAFAASVGARGGLFAFPRELEVAASPEGEGAWMAAPVAGPASERGDGSRVAPGVLQVRLGAQGLEAGPERGAAPGPGQRPAPR